MHRLGLVPAKTAAVDLGVGSGELPRDFDRVLVDAPCTGTGSPATVRRSRCGSLRTIPARLAALAEAILRRAAGLVRPGGRVVFAVCSVLRTECEAVVDCVSDVLARPPSTRRSCLEDLSANPTPAPAFTRAPRRACGRLLRGQSGCPG